jgi:uncharacterized protein YacL
MPKKTVAKKINQQIKAETVQAVDGLGRAIHFSPKAMGILADEIAKTVVNRLPSFRRTRKPKETKKIENAIFLDTSAIIDGRIFEVINLGLLRGEIVILESILLELKHIADSKDLVKRERGRKGLVLLEKIRRVKEIKFTVLSSDKEKSMGLDKLQEVDERLIFAAKQNRGRLITCDYNLEKKASINGVSAINVNTLANVLKVIAVPGETLHIKIQHKGKDLTQGVGYLDDGTMIVVENASADLGKELNVVVSRVIQTSAGRILFSKKLL